MKKLFNNHSTFWTEKPFLGAVAFGLVLLAASLIINNLANSYTVSHVSNSVTDILLDNLPTVNVDFIFSDGAMIFLFIVAFILLYEPRRIPFALKAIALFIFIRSLFLVLTHIAPPLHGSPIDVDSLINKFSYGDDLFFSEHTGLPFMLALVFWREKYLRYFFIVATVIGASAVLLGHLHYSIDVFSAFFISFGIFNIAKVFFGKDYELLKQPYSRAVT